MDDYTIQDTVNIEDIKQEEDNVLQNEESDKLIYIDSKPEQN